MFNRCLGVGLLSFLVMSAALANPPMGQLPAPGVYLNAEGSPLLPLIQNATTSLDIEIYTMQSPTVRQLLRGALRRGVRIRVVKDPNPLGESCNVFGGGAMGPEASSSADCSDQQSLVDEIRQSGGAYVPFNKQALCPNGGGGDGHGCFEHGKIALADGLALVSTGNFDATNLCIQGDGEKSCDRDYTLIDPNPEIYQTLERLFEADLQGESYDVRSVIPADLASILTVSPQSLAPLVDFINGAESTIELEAQYLKDPQMNDAILAAARRGVHVSITVASACAFGKPKAAAAREFQQTYQTLEQAGAQASMFNSSNTIHGLPGYMHAKVIVVDGNRAWLGSENGSAESLTQNREYGVIFNDAASVQKILSTIADDHNSPDSESWQESLSCAKDRSRTGSSISYGEDAHQSRAPRPASGTAPKPRKPRKPIVRT